MGYNPLPKLTPTAEETCTRLHQPRRLHVVKSLADVGASVTMAVALYRGGEIVGVLWPFAGMAGVYLCLRAIGFIAYCMRADEWETISLRRDD